jgi:hypothetical protein
MSVGLGPLVGSPRSVRGEKEMIKVCKEVGEQVSNVSRDGKDTRLYKSRSGSELISTYPDTGFAGLSPSFRDK